MNIVVLAGGLSPERDVSLSTGAMAVNALLCSGHQPILLDLFYGVSEPLPEPVAGAFLRAQKLPARPVPQVAPDLAAVRAGRKSGFSPIIGSGVTELCRAADLVYLALHGDCGENGSLQAFFDLMGVRYTGSPSFGCALAMNKWVTKQIFNSAGILTPRGAVVTREHIAELDQIGYPCVVKPCNGGSSIGVSIVHDEAERAKALEEAFCYENEVVVEEYVRGREISCGILGDTALPIIEIIPRSGFYDYANKYQPGWTEEITPARIDPETTKQIQDAALAAYHALKLAVYARVDFLLTDDGLAYCLEANTLPGMTPTSLLPQEAAVNGIDYPTLCNEIVALSLRKYQ